MPVLSRAIQAIKRLGTRRKPRNEPTPRTGDQR